MKTVTADTSTDKPMPQNEEANRSMIDEFLKTKGPSVKIEDEVWYKEKYLKQDEKFEYKTDEVVEETVQKTEVEIKCNTRCREVFESLGYKYKVRQELDYEEVVKRIVKSIRSTTNRMLKKEANKIREEWQTAA